MARFHYAHAKPKNDGPGTKSRSASATGWVDDRGQASGYFPELEARLWLNVESAERLFAFSPLSFEEAREASLGDVPRSALADQYVIYSAHLDHIGVVTNDEEEEGDKINNGMYDNAMGVALMLETARAIAAAQPKRSVLFIALTAEESGLLGSDYFVNNPTVPIDALVLAPDCRPGCVRFATFVAAKCCGIGRRG